MPPRRTYYKAIEVMSVEEKQMTGLRHLCKELAELHPCQVLKEWSA